MQDMNDYIKPVLQRKPEKIILHVGTNNLWDDQAKDIKRKIASLVEIIRSDQPFASIADSSIMQRADNATLRKSVDQANW